MTTEVTIRASHSTKKEVRVTINDKVTGDIIESFTLQDTETASRYVYDDRIIMVSEVEKNNPEQGG